MTWCTANSEADRPKRGPGCSRRPPLVFYAEGIQAVGIDRIVAEAQVTRATLYRHFPGKEDLVRAYRDAADQAMRGQTAKAIAAVRTGIRTIRDRQPDLTVVGEARDGREAVEQSRSLRPDVVLMDTRLPMLDGMAAIREIVGSGRAGDDNPGVLSGWKRRRQAGQHRSIDRRMRC